MIYTITSTPLFNKWVKNLKDSKARKAIANRLVRIQHGNFGDHKRLSKSLYELRFTLGSGYRIYYAIDNHTVIILIAGGDKSSQAKDIKNAEKMIEDL